MRMKTAESRQIKVASSAITTAWTIGTFGAAHLRYPFIAFGGSRSLKWIFVIPLRSAYIVRARSVNTDLINAAKYESSLINSRNSEL